MRTPSSLAAITVVACLAGARVARADAPRPAEMHACWAELVTSDPAACVDCATTYASQDDCAATHLVEGRERRCVYRGRDTIFEVWCRPGAPAAPAASGATASDADGVASTTGTGAGATPGTTGCTLNARADEGGSGAALVAFAAIAAATARRLRGRFRRAPHVAALGVVAAAGAAALVGCTPEPTPEARTGIGEHARSRRPDELRKLGLVKELEGLLGPRKGGELVDPWSAATTFEWGAFRGTLPLGWGAEGQQNGHAWYAPKDDRVHGVSLRLQRWVELVNEEDVRQPSSPVVLGVASPIPPATLARVPFLMHGAPPRLVVERAAARDFDGRAALVIETTLGSVLKQVAVVFNAELDTGEEPSLDILRMAYPVSLASRYDGVRDTVLGSLSLTRSVRARTCDGKLVSELDEPCETVCAGRDPAHARADALRSRGYDLRCGVRGCARWCLSKDPKKVADRIAAFKRRRPRVPCKATDPLCDDL